MADIKRAIAQTYKKFKKDGFSKTALRVKEVLADKRNEAQARRKNPEACTFYDVVFINGCDYSVAHPIRFRVDHQIEQLEAFGLRCLRLEVVDIDDSVLGKGRAFIIFRCPITSAIEGFIEKAHNLNKSVFFDVDDLVVDTFYTDQIKEVQKFSPEQKAQYDDGVHRMRATLEKCGRAITTTETLQRELGKIVPDVFVNRNVASENMLSYSMRALKNRENNTGCNGTPSDNVTIGYFSGSITHNEDIGMILPVLVEIMGRYQNLRLKIVGELDALEALAPFRDRIEAVGFLDWRNLQESVSDVDIAIAPLVDNIFNDSKSENKWIEASLVKVPMVASDVGGFSKMIDNGVTGYLCSSNEQWIAALSCLIENPCERKRIAERAFTVCTEHCLTLNSGYGLSCYLRENMNPNIFFVLPGINISGGVLVALHHCCILQDAGFDVNLISFTNDYGGDLFEFNQHIFPVLDAMSVENEDTKHLLLGRIDTMVATMWSTTALLDEFTNVGKKKYLVQHRETIFYDPPNPWRCAANATYSKTDYDILTISRWCEQWLESDFGRCPTYIPNGIDRISFYPAKRDFSSNKIRILIEGDCVAEHKNVDEAFRIVEKLDRGRFEVWYISYGGEPKEWYEVDRFFHKIPFEGMPDIYRQCHILLKTSLSESFSYPPLEMMATGGFTVSNLNEGNSEYLQDGVNCLVYETGNIDSAIEKILRLCNDEALRNALLDGGFQTADERNWSNLKGQIVEAYSQ